jgi:hypothetical protein
VPCNRTVAYLSVAVTNCFDIQTYIFRSYLRFHEPKRGMFDEKIALHEEMYTRICEWTYRSVLQRHCSKIAGLLAESGEDLDRAEWWASVQKTYSLAYAMKSNNQY